MANKCFNTGKFRKLDTYLRKDSTNEKKLMAADPLTVNDLQKAYIEYHGKF